jgi:hypothetical protein
MREDIKSHSVTVLQFFIRQHLTIVMQGMVTDLMGSTDEVHIVLLQESRDDVWTECERHPPVIF